MAVLAASSLTYAISQTMVIPALPQIRSDLGADTASTSWVVSAFFISSAVSTGVVGRLADMFGKRRMLMIAMALYGGGALAGALAPSLVTLVAARVVMGFGAGVVPVAYAIARDEVQPPRLSRSIGSIAMMIGLGAGIGMPLGGILVDQASWHLCFAVAAGLSGLVIVLVAWVVPESSLRSPARVDVAGAACLAVGLGSFLVAVTRGSLWGWTDVRTLGLAAAGCVVLAMFVVHEQRIAAPLIDIATLRLRPVWLTNLGSFGMGAGQVAVSILVVQLAQVPTSSGGLGSSAFRAGALLLPYSLTMVAGAQCAGFVMERVSGRIVMMAGAAICIAGLVGLATAPVATASLAGFSALSGFGIAMTLVAAPSVLAAVVPQARAGEANGINTIARAVGQGFGTQITAAVIAAGTLAGADVPEAVIYDRAFWLSAGACAIAVVSAALIRSRRAATTHLTGVATDPS